MLPRTLPSLILIPTILATSSASAGPDWTEVPDAGRITPQVVGIPVQPETIVGELAGMDADGGPDIADTYTIRVDKPGTFVATTGGIGGVPDTGLSTTGSIGGVGDTRASTTNFNTRLYLFQLSRVGLLANDNISPTRPVSRLLAFSTDGTDIRIPAPGNYILAVSFGDVFPVNANGQIFSLDDPLGGPFQVSGPDGSGGTAPFNGWAGNIVARPPAKYAITILNECGAAPAPCPADVNGDRFVTFADITAVLIQFGTACP